MNMTDKFYQSLKGHSVTYALSKLAKDHRVSIATIQHLILIEIGEDELWNS